MSVRMLIFFAFLGSTVASAQTVQSVMVSPGTVVLSSEHRASTVVVGSSSDELTTIEVEDGSFIQQPTGQLSAVDSKTVPNSAASFLRVGPRKFTLTPGQGQQVRVAARPPKDLAPGEYRMHLLMANRGTGSVQPQEVESNQLTEGLNVIIPIRVVRGVRVLYRHQVQPEGGHLERLTLLKETDRKMLEFDVVRLGQTSLLAKCQVFIRDAVGNPTDFGQESGINIYPENQRRHYAVDVSAAELPKGAQFCVKLTPDDPGNNQLKQEVMCTD